MNNIVMTGRVSSVSVVNESARVIFADKTDTDGNPHISAPLKVLDRGDDWLPEVGQFVLCLFLPNGESDGFILGGL